MGFAACAQGNQLGVGGSAGTGVLTGAVSSSATSSGAGGGPGGVGAPCPDGRCEEGTCTLVGQTKYCTVACPPNCPTGTYCSIVAGNPLCIPDLNQECDQCKTSADCKQPSDACLTAPAGDSFCARDCSVDGLCSNGYVCVGMESYEETDGGTEGGTDDGGSSSSSSGSSSHSSSSSGGVGGAGGAGGASGDGGVPLPTMPVRWCVPPSGASCPCNAQRDGVSNACYDTNTYGTCAGTETCDGASSTWKGCTAMVPAAEVCNGKDDNCNGQIDEGDPNVLCASFGPPPLNGNWSCVNGVCLPGTCDPGYTSYPAGSTGCPCKVDANEPNGSCAAAKAVGTVTSTSPAGLTITGTLSSDTDVDYYSFSTTDVAQASTNSYHVAVSFTAPAANTEFQMDVERGGPCIDAPTGPGANLTSYDWCVNGQSGMIGEAPCGPTSTNHCNDYSSVYYIRVHRVAGVTGTCTPYTISITADGGACPVFTQCM